MVNLGRVKERFILVAVILGAVNLFLLVYLLWPRSSGPSQGVLKKQSQDLQQEVELWKKSNPEKTRADLKHLYSENLPSRVSQISQQVDKLLHQTGITAQSIHYPPEISGKDVLPDVQQIKIETNVTGDYSKVARFINALEQDKMLFIIEKISLTGEQSGVVSLQISFSTFLRQAA